MKVFIDTSAFVALFVDKEKSHPEVTKKYVEYKRQRAVFLTSYYILDELFTRLLYYKLDIRTQVQKLKEAINQGELTVLQIDEAVFNKTIDKFLKFSDHKISFTDATTYVLYKNFVLDEIFTLDNDFKKMRLNTSF